MIPRIPLPGEKADGDGSGVEDKDNRPTAAFVTAEAPRMGTDDFRNVSGGPLAGLDQEEQRTVRHLMQGRWSSDHDEPLRSSRRKNVRISRALLSSFENRVRMQSFSTHATKDRSGFRQPRSFPFSWSPR